MAATLSSAKGSELSKAEYLKRYLSKDEASSASKGKLKKKRRKVVGKGLKIVDDDVDWKEMLKEEKEAKQAEEDDEEAPVIAEVIDDRPEEVKHLEIFKTGNRWKVIGVDEDKHSENEPDTEHQNSSDLSPAKRARHDSPDISPPRRSRHDSPDISPPRRNRHDSPDLSPQRKKRHDSPDISPPRRSRHDSPDMSPPRRHKGKSVKGHNKDKSPAKRKSRKDSDSDQSPPRRKTAGASDSDQSPPRRARQDSDSDQSPPRRRPRGGSDEDLSPPRRPGQSREKMLSGGKAGLVSREVLRKEQEDNRRREKNNRQQEDESRSSQTVFRDKTGKKRDLASEREELERQAGEKAVKDEKYAQWGRGLAQGQMHQQKLEDALREAQKPLARHSNDEDLDRFLREQEREGDPMAAMLRKKKERTSKTSDKPRYKGPLPPINRFNIMPGYRWDGVNRSNGFEEKRFARIADKKAMQEAAYKWSVEDM
ncbi:BUD13 homolog [Synchiropus splendidus]|uniref:BUD13 homolog n=1 Tax=Synchiropus splendidus TaxID=270530 RepID=UPI00237DB4AA|nr:BUD13 homolog [Synchiropus splendidus]